MNEYFKKYMETAHPVGDPGVVFAGNLRTATIRPTKPIDYMEGRPGIEPAFSLTYTRKINLTPKDALYFSMVTAHAEAREKSRLISIFARQLNALNEDRRKNLDYVFGRTN